jgi:hypothetical protein
MSTLLSTEQVHTLVASAMRDSTLRQALLDDPYAVVQSQLGIELPAGMTLHVLQGETQTVTVVIPQAPSDWPAGLSVEAACERLRSAQPEPAGKTQRALEFQMQLVARAWQDEAFKQCLLRDPKGAVEEELGVDLPDALSLRFVAEDEINQYVILPPELAGMELTDEQLEQVAGGEVLTVAFTVYAGSLVASAISAAVTIIATHW